MRVRTEDHSAKDELRRQRGPPAGLLRPPGIFKSDPPRDQVPPESSQWNSAQGKEKGGQGGDSEFETVRHSRRHPRPPHVQIYHPHDGTGTNPGKLLSRGRGD